MFGYGQTTNHNGAHAYDADGNRVAAVTTQAYHIWAQNVQTHARSGNGNESFDALDGLLI